MNFTITDESQIIKKETVIGILNEYQECLQDLKEIGLKMNESTSKQLNKKALYVDGITMDKQVVEIGSFIIQSVNSLNAQVNSTKDEVERVYNEQWKELNRYRDYLRELEEQKQRNS